MVGWWMVIILIEIVGIYPAVHIYGSELEMELEERVQQDSQPSGPNGFWDKCSSKFDMAFVNKLDHENKQIRGI